MRSTIRIAVLCAALAAVVVGSVVLSRRHGEGAGGASGPSGADAAAVALDPLDAIPDGALLVATVDVRALRRTAIGERFLGKGRTIPGLGAVTEVCSADPMDGVIRLAVAVPAQGGEADFGVFVTGRLDADALLDCAKTVVERRGGRPIVSPAGRFRVLRDLSAADAGAELAVAPGGPVLLGQGAYLRSSIDAVEGRLPSIRGNAEHARLRALVPDGAVVATVVLTPSLRQTLAQELAAQGTPESPFLAVVGAAASLELAAELRFELALQCDRPGTCAEAAAILERTSRARGQALGDRAPELSALLGELAYRVEANALHVSLSVSTRRALGVLDEVLAASPPPAASASPSAAPSAARPAPAATAAPH